MTSWTVKTQTDDPRRALEIAQDQRNRGYTVLIEDEHGQGVDDQLLKPRDVTLTRTVRERAIGLLFALVAVVAGLGILYLTGWWVDH